MMKKLEDKVVFITGGNSGIGKASALEAAREGAIIVVADLASKDHGETIAEIKALGNSPCRLSGCKCGSSGIARCKFC